MLVEACRYVAALGIPLRPVRRADKILIEMNDLETAMHASEQDVTAPVWIWMEASPPDPAANWYRPDWVSGRARVE